MAESSYQLLPKRGQAIMHDEMQEIVNLYNPGYMGRIKGKHLRNTNISTPSSSKSKPNISYSSKDVFLSTNYELSASANKSEQKVKYSKRTSMETNNPIDNNDDYSRLRNNFTKDLQNLAECIQPRKNAFQIKNFPMKTSYKSSESDTISNAIAYVNKDCKDSIIQLINMLRIDTPLCTMLDKSVKTKHIDDICCSDEIETVNKWIVSLLPNRQLRLEDKNECYRIRLSKVPIFEKGNVIVEGCLVPGGHLFRLEFALDISDKEKNEWLTIKDNRYTCNESVIDYMTRHPHGALESIRSKLRIAFIHDPHEVGNSLKMLETFNCYYTQRHFYYKAIGTEFVGHLKIGKWGARKDIGALFFIAEGAPEDGTDYLMAMVSDITWFRAWQATIYADFQPSKHIQIGTEHTITPLKVDFLAIHPLIFGRKLTSYFEVGKFVFDYATREFSSVNLMQRKEHFQAYRIIGKHSSEKQKYDFKITGQDMQTKTIVDFQVRVVISENRQAWEDALAIPLTRAYAFLEMVFKELSDRGYDLCGMDNEEGSPHTFDELTQLIAVLPKMEVLGTILSTLRLHHLEAMALLTFDALYHPLILLEEAEKMSITPSIQLTKICRSIERTRILQLVYQHMHKFKTTTNPISPVNESKAKNWRKIVPHLLRLPDIKLHNSYEIIERVTTYFDKAEIGSPK